MKPVLSFFALMPCLLAGQTHPAWAGRLPDAALNLKLKAPITTWDEAVPLGNGLLGGLLWGEGSRLRLSLDRGDLWDERVAPEFREKAFTFANLVHLVHTRNQTEINRLINFPYNRPVPSKIPAGRLEIELAPTQRLTDFELDLATAQGIAHLSDGPRLTVFFSADSPVALLYVPGPAPRSLRLIAPASVAKLGYPPARPGQEGTFQWFVQEAVEGPSFCVYLGSARTGGGTLVSLAITSSRDGGDPLRLARQRVALALAKGYEV
jgi:alpha-L-fucosidase 2